jgi:hypothetical protein
MRQISSSMALEETRAENGHKLHQIGVNAIFYAQFRDSEAALCRAEHALVIDARATKSTCEVDDAYEPESDPGSNRRCGSGISRHGAARITSGGAEGERSKRVRIPFSAPPAQQ